MNNTDKSFTVLLPIYNRPDLHEMFDKAISSCLNNSIKPDELIVIVDGPLNQEFTNKVRGYELNKIVKILWLTENIGLSKALNEGLKIVTTKYVFRADGDDINSLDRFEIQLDLLSKGFQLVGGAISEVDRNGNIIAYRRPPLKSNEILKFAQRRNPFNHMTVAFELDPVVKLGGYPDIYLKEDWALWVLLLEQGIRCCKSDKILVSAATDIAMYSRRGGFKNALSEIKMQYLLYIRIKKNPLLCIMDYLLKIAILSTPSFIKRFVYINLLRRKV